MLAVAVNKKGSSVENNQVTIECLKQGRVILQHSEITYRYSCCTSKTQTIIGLGDSLNYPSIGPSNGWCNAAIHRKQLTGSLRKSLTNSEQLSNQPSRIVSRVSMVLDCDTRLAYICLHFYMPKSRYDENRTTGAKGECRHQTAITFKRSAIHTCHKEKWGTNLQIMWLSPTVGTALYYPSRVHQYTRIKVQITTRHPPAIALSQRPNSFENISNGRWRESALFPL